VFEMSKNGKSKRLRVIMIGAHPDDGEYYSGGTAALWAQAGAKVQIVAVTNGDAGHQNQSRGVLARRRAAECTRSAGILGVSCRTLDIHDGEVLPSLKARKAVIRAIRQWKADIVITHRTNDYHPDHRYTGQIVQDAAYLVAVPSICPDTPRLEDNPIFMYFRDDFKKPEPFKADVVVDVTPVMDKKWHSMHSMESQMYEWIPWLEKKLEEVPSSPQERLEWLKGFMGDHFRSWVDGLEEIIAERYGAEHVSKVEFAEAFELCEYGRQPSREQLWKMFP